MMGSVHTDICGFHVRSFDALTSHELYEIFRARADVFIGEEKILYPDADGLDYKSLHVFCTDYTGRVTAYLRMFPKEDEPGTVQMGRVLTRIHGTGVGKKLLNAGIQAARECLDAREIYVESQKHAEGFYLKAGFAVASEDFVEAGIPHVQMRMSLGLEPGSGQSLLQLLDEMPIGSYIIRPDHTVVYWNPEAESLLGFTSEEMCGRKCIDMPLGCSFASGGRIQGQFCPAVVAYRTGRSSSLQMFMRRKDGSDLLVRNVLMPLKDQDGRVTQLLSFFFPLADKDYDSTMLRDLYEMATRDALTCLPGRKYMEACLQEEMEKFKRTGNPFAVLFADMDYLHEINNTHGHETGDKMLKEIGLMLRRNSRKADRFCRWGGDEFVGLLQLKQLEDIKSAAIRLKTAAEKCEIEVRGRKISCQTAIGITVVRDDDTIRSLVDRADRYMYEAKKIVGNQIVTDFTER